MHALSPKASKAGGLCRQLRACQGRHDDTIRPNEGYIKHCRWGEHLDLFRAGPAIDSSTTCGMSTID